MRIRPHVQQVIRTAILRADPNAEVYLFGSRTDDSARGGDIDLLVLSQHINLMAKLDVLVEIRKQLGEQKIDLVIYSDKAEAFAQIALEKAIPL